MSIETRKSQTQEEADHHAMLEHAFKGKLVDPEIVKGIFFYNRKLTTDHAPYIADVYPTVLGLLGVKAPYELDGVELK